MLYRLSYKALSNAGKRRYDTSSFCYAKKLILAAQPMYE